MRNRFDLACVALVWAALSGTPALALEVDYTLTPLGAEQYQYSYSVINNGSTGSPVGLFDVLFDPSLYDETSLQITSDPGLSSAWSQQFLASAPGVPAAYDVQAVSDSLAIGASARGFAVTFTWLGAGTPGSQGFEVYDPESFALLETGTTTPAPVPLPASGSLAASALIALLLFSFRFRTRRVEIS